MFVTFNLSSMFYCHGTDLLRASFTRKSARLQRFYQRQDHIRGWWSHKKMKEWTRCHPSLAHMVMQDASRGRRQSSRVYFAPRKGFDCCAGSWGEIRSCPGSPLFPRRTAAHPRFKLQTQLVLRINTVKPSWYFNELFYKKTLLDEPENCQ